MNNDKKVFAFKLAEKKEQQKDTTAKWKARDGVSVAGCTLLRDGSNYRMNDIWNGDTGYYC